MSVVNFRGIWIMNNCLRRIKRLEKLFSDNFYNGRGKTAFNIEEGSIPIMVSAPHAINQFREGKVKIADMYTGGIAKYLHEKTGCHVIYSCMYTESDPNYDEFEVNKYQKELLEYVNKHNILLLLDIHGAAKERDYAVEMGTAPTIEQLSENSPENLLNNPNAEDPSLLQYKFIDDIIRIILEDKFKNHSIAKKNIEKNILFYAGDQNTVTKSISERSKTACIQLEINGEYRNPDNQNEFISLVESLIAIINFFSKIDWKERPQKIIEECIRSQG